MIKITTGKRGPAREIETGFNPVDKTEYLVLERIELVNEKINIH